MNRTSYKDATAFSEGCGFFALNAAKSGPVVWPSMANILKGGVKAVEKNGAEKELSEKGKKLIDLIRSISYGEIRIAVREGEPVLVEEVKKSIKL